jgi:Domain of unknown function (DUF5666)
MNIKKYTLASLATLAVFGSLVAVPAFAEDSVNAQVQGGATISLPGATSVGMDVKGRGEFEGRGMMKSGVFGKVTAVSGNTITVAAFTRAGMMSGPQTTSVTYTVDATNTKIMKAGVAGSISSIVVGDTIMVNGTVSGTSITARSINDGPMPIKMKDKNKNRENDNEKDTEGEHSAQTPVITGNGQPVVAGTITSITGSSMVITNKSNVAYTVDVTSAKVALDNKLVTVSSLKVGDSVVVQGAVSGSSITASSVIDNTISMAPQGGDKKPAKGFFGNIGGFFSRIFGF